MKSIMCVCVCGGRSGGWEGPWRDRDKETETERWGETTSEQRGVCVSVCWGQSTQGRERPRDLNGTWGERRGEGVGGVGGGGGLGGNGEAQ